MSVDAKFIRDIDPYFQYPTDENPTTQQEYQEAVRNWVTTEEAIVDSHLWQPTTNYNVGNQIKTPSLPPQCVLVCTAAGTSGNEEPDYTNVDVGDSVTDGTVTWLVSETLTSAGGTMGSSLKWDGVNDNTFAVGMSDSNNDNVDIGWTYEDKTGAGIGLRNISHSDGGAFNIWATDGTNIKTLVGKANGDLTWSGSLYLTDYIYKNRNNSVLSLNGGSDGSSGAYLNLYGKDHASYPSRFVLTAFDGNTRNQLVGRTDGVLTWMNNNVLTDETVGTVVSNSASSDVNIGVTTARNLISLSLAAGKWVVTGHVRLDSITANKLYGIEISTTSNSYNYGTDSAISVHSSGAGIISMQTSRIVTTTTNTTVYLCGYATAACTATGAYLRAIRIA